MWYPGLHAMRGIAALLIVLLHAYWTWPFALYDFTRKLYLGVDLFFILSGFVVCLKYHDAFKTKGALRQFAYARLVRLRSVYYVSGFIWFCAFWFFYAHSQSGVDHFSIFVSLLRYILGIDVFFGSEYVKVNPVAWSLMVEVWTYAIFGLLFSIVKESRGRLFISLLISVASLLYLANFHSSLNIVYGSAALIRCFSGFFLGVAIRETQGLWARFGLKLFSILLVLLVSVFHFFIRSNIDIEIMLGLALIILLAIAINNKSRPMPAVFIWLGNISYSLYLWHFLISVVLAKMLRVNFGMDNQVIFEGETFVSVPFFASIFYLSVYLSISLVVGSLSYWILEQRNLKIFLLMKDRLRFVFRP